MDRCDFAQLNKILDTPQVDDHRYELINCESNTPRLRLAQI